MGIENCNKIYMIRLIVSRRKVYRMKSIFFMPNPISLNLTCLLAMKLVLIYSGHLGGKTFGGLKEAVIIDLDNPTVPLKHNKSVEYLKTQLKYDKLLN